MKRWSTVVLGLLFIFVVPGASSAVPRDPEPCCCAKTCATDDGKCSMCRIAPGKISLSACGSSSETGAPIIAFSFVALAPAPVPFAFTRENVLVSLAGDPDFSAEPPPGPPPRISSPFLTTF